VAVIAGVVSPSRLAVFVIISCRGTTSTTTTTTATTTTTTTATTATTTTTTTATTTTAALTTTAAAPAAAGRRPHVIPRPWGRRAFHSGLWETKGGWPGGVVVTRGLPIRGEAWSA
jgi:hypothetical protein